MKLKQDKPLSSFAFNIKLRHYLMEMVALKPREGMRAAELVAAAKEYLAGGGEGGANGEDAALLQGGVTAASTIQETMESKHVANEVANDLTTSGR